MSWMPEKEKAEAEAARIRADAWARSVPGTPYGVTEPVLEKPRSGKPPEPLDQRRLAQILSRPRGGAE